MLMSRSQETCYIQPRCKSSLFRTYCSSVHTAHCSEFTVTCTLNNRIFEASWGDFKQILDSSTSNCCTVCVLSSSFTVVDDEEANIPELNVRWDTAQISFQKVTLGDKLPKNSINSQKPTYLSF